MIYNTRCFLNAAEGRVSAMGEAMEYFRERTNIEKARQHIEEMSEYERPLFFSGPTRISMIGKYFLAFMVLNVHLLFWWGTGSDAPGDGASQWLVFLHATVGLLGISGFFLLMLVLTKINHFMNFSTSGGWFTTSLLLIALTPGIFFLEEQITEGLLATVIGFVGEAPGSFIPFDWNPQFYLMFGIGYTILLVFLTEFYRKAFVYAVTDKQIYLSKEFLKILDTSSHVIQLDGIENLKVQRDLIGRFTNIGNVHVITASGMGLKSDSVEVGGGMAASLAGDDSKSSNPVMKIIKLLILMMKFQRTRKTVDENPEDCIYGVRNPMMVHKLINELRTRPDDMPLFADEEESAAEPAAAEPASEEPNTEA